MNVLNGFTVELRHQLGSSHPTTLLTPLDEDQLCAMVVALGHEGRNARPAGIGCSTTPNMIADGGFTLSLQHFKTLRMVTHDEIEVGAGVMAEELFTFLNSRHLQMGANFTFPFFRLGGVAVSCYACEAYLSGQSYFSSHVTRYELVTADGQKRTVSETENARLLPFLRTSTGLLGIVHHFRLRVYPNAQFGMRLTLYRSPAELLRRRDQHGMKGAIGWAPYTGATFIQQHALENHTLRPPYTSPGYKVFSWALNHLATFPWRRRMDRMLRLTPGSGRLTNDWQFQFKVNPNYIKQKFDDWRNRLCAWDFSEDNFPRALVALEALLRHYRKQHRHEVILVGIWRFEPAPAAVCGHLHTNFDGVRQSLVIVTDASTDPALQSRLEREWAATALSLGGRPQIQKGVYEAADFEAAFGAEHIEAYRQIIYESDPNGLFAHPQLSALLRLDYPKNRL